MFASTTSQTTTTTLQREFRPPSVIRSPKREKRLVSNDKKDVRSDKVENETVPLPIRVSFDRSTSNRNEPTTDRRIELIVARAFPNENVRSDDSSGDKTIDHRVDGKPTVVRASKITRDEVRTQNVEEEDMLAEETNRLRERIEALEIELAAERQIRRDNEARSPNVQQQAAMRRDIDALTERQTVTETLLEQIESNVTKLGKDPSIVADTWADSWTRRVSFAWIDMHGEKTVNDRNDVLHPYLTDDIDVLAVHGLTIKEKRLSTQARRVDGIDVFKPVLRWRNQYMVLGVRSVKENSAVCSGICLNVDLNFKPSERNVQMYESKNLRALTVHGTLFDERPVVFAIVYPLVDDHSSNGEQRDALELLRRIVVEARDSRVFLMGDFTIPAVNFESVVKKLRSDEFITLESELDVCSGYIRTSMQGNNFRHNVHALTHGGGSILDFYTSQTVSNSIYVRTRMTMEEPFRRRVRCLRRGGLIHDKIVV